MLRRTSRRQPIIFADFGAQLLDVLALLADHDARTGGVDRDVDACLAARSIRMRLTDASASFLLQELAHPEVGDADTAGNCFLFGVPLRRPVTGDAKADANRIDLLTHGLLVLLAVADDDSDVAVALDDAGAAALGARARSASASAPRRP